MSPSDGRLLPKLKQKFGNQKSEDFREVETTVTRWLRKRDTDFINGD